MKNMTIEQWRRFALPENLFFLLQESYKKEYEKISYVQVREVVYEMLGKKIIDYKDNDDQKNADHFLNIQKLQHNKLPTTTNEVVVDSFISSRKPIISNHRPSHCDYSHSKMVYDNNSTHDIVMKQKISNDNVTTGSIMSDPNPETNQRNKIRSRTTMGGNHSAEIDLNKINTLIDQIIQSVKIKEDAKKMLEMLLIIFSDLKTGEERFRKINIGKICQTYAYPAIEALLYYCSFIKLDSTYFKYQKEIDIQMINIVILSLNNHIKTQFQMPICSIVNSALNNQESHIEDHEKEIQLSTITTLPSPSSSIISSLINNTEATTAVVNSPEENKSIPVLLEEERLFRVKKLIDYDTPIARNPKCILITSSKIQQNFIEEFDQSVNIIQLTEEDKRHIEEVSLLIAMDQSIEFTLQRGELTNLLKQPLIITADFFFIFPDNYILHGTFCIKEQIQTLHDYISKYLQNPRTQFYLVKEGRTYPDMTDVIKDQKDMIFGKPIILNVVFPNEYCKLNAQSLQNILIASPIK